MTLGEDYVIEMTDQFHMDKVEFEGPTFRVKSHKTFAWTECSKPGRRATIKINIHMCCNLPKDDFS